MNRLNREINALLLNPSIKGAAWTLGPIHGRPAMMDLGCLGLPMLAAVVLNDFNESR